MPSKNYITLSELASQVKSILSGAFAFRHYWVIADITDHKFYASKGTHYFCLADKHPKTHALSAKLSAVAWPDSGALAISAFQQATGQVFRSDIRVLVNVAVSYHQVYGLQLVLNDIDASFTIGQLEEQRLAVLDRLTREHAAHVFREGDHYRTTNKGLSLSKVIQRVAVVSSSSAAGYIDFRNTLETNRYDYHIQLTPYFTTVQGAGNATGLCQTLAAVSQSATAYDAVVIIRGGGAQTDLLLFNQYEVAAMVAAFPIPVISGIGHQINETLTDLMAHTSVKTPSIAAESILSHNRTFEEALVRMQRSILLYSRQLLHEKHQHLATANSHLVSRAGNMLQQHRQRLSGLGLGLTSRSLVHIGKQQQELRNAGDKLHSGIAKRIAANKQELDRFQSVVRLMNPEHLMKRGFALLYKNGRLASGTHLLDEGDHITLQLSGSSIEATIQLITINQQHTDEHDL